MKKIIAVIVMAVLLVSILGACTQPPAEAPAAQTPATEESQAPKSEAPKAENAEAPAAAGEPVTLTWAVFETANFTPEFYQHIIDTFEADNPDIKIEKVLMTGDSRMQFQKTMLAAGTFPDVTMEANDLANIEGVYAEVPEALISKYQEGTLAKTFGKYTTLPAGMQYRIQCYYNKDMFEAAGITAEPKTWDEFIAACEALKKQGSVPLICGGAKDIWATGLYRTSTANQDLMQAYPNFNRDYLDGKVKWTDEVNVRTMEAWKSLVDAGYYHKGSMSFGYGQAAEEFTKGAAAMMLDGSWAAVGADTAGNDNLGVFVMPSPDGINTYCTANIYWAVAESCQNKDQAFKFVEYVLGGNPELYAYFLKADGYGATTKEAIDYERGPLMTKFLQNYEGMTVVPEIVKVLGDDAMPPGTQDMMDKSMQAMFTGADVKAELEKWDTETQRLLEAVAANTAE